MTPRSHALTIEEAFDECVELLLAGKPLDAYLNAHPELASELEPLLEAATGMRAARSVPARQPEVAAASRQAFMQAARAAVAPRRSPGPLEALAVWWANLLRGFAGPNRVAYALATLLVVIALTGLSGTGVIVASASALPGDPLYQVKLVGEQVQLLLARDEATRLALEEANAARRLQEAQAIVGLRRPATSVRIAGVLEGFSEAEWLVSGLTIKITPQSVIYGEPEIGAVVQGNAQAPGDGSLVALWLTVLPNSRSVALPADTPTPTAEPPTPTATSTEPIPTVTATTTQPAPTITDTPEPTRTPLPTVTPTWTRTPTRLPTLTFTPGPSPTPMRVLQPGRKFGFLISKIGNAWLIREIDTELQVLVDGNTILQNDPQPGDRVEADLIVRNGAYVVSRINAVGKAEATPVPIDFLGLIEKMGGEWWTVNGITFRVWGETEVDGEPGIDRQAEVHAVQRSNGEIWARKVVVRSIPEYQFTDMIELVGRDRLIVGGRTIYADSHTQLSGDPPMVGRWADVTCIQAPYDRLLARQIYVRPSTPTPGVTISPTRRPTRTFTPQPSTIPTKVPSPTFTLTPRPSSTPISTATDTPVPAPSATAVPTATSTHTATPVPPTATVSSPPTSLPGASPTKTQ